MFRTCKGVVRAVEGLVASNSRIGSKNLEVKYYLLSGKTFNSSIAVSVRQMSHWLNATTSWRMVTYSERGSIGATGNWGPAQCGFPTRVHVQGVVDLAEQPGGCPLAVTVDCSGVTTQLREKDYHIQFTFTSRFCPTVVQSTLSVFVYISTSL